MNTESPSETSPSISDQAPLRMTVADLPPVAGLFDEFDETVFALCATDFAIDGMTSSTERFCHQLRHAADADTVYIVDRLSLKIIATTSCAGDVGNDDTSDIHNALVNMISDLENCRTPLQLPDIAVFPDQKKMSFAVIPLGSAFDRLAILVDADNSLRGCKQYYADAVRALYSCHTASPEQYFAPSTKQLQKGIFDTLNRQYGMCSQRISERRLELFCEDLRQVDVQFEKILELDNSGRKAIWGWDVTANCCDTDQFPGDLFTTAEEWQEEFRTTLDLHLLQKAAYRYKDVCEAGNLLRLDDIKPLCLNVYPQSLQKTDYINCLRELTEKVVIHGSRLVFEISDKTPFLNGDSAERQSELQDFARLLKSLREEFGIRIALDEFGTGHSPLSRLKCLEPDILKINKSMLDSGPENDLDFIERFREVSASRQTAPLEVILESDDGDPDTLSGTSATTRKKFHSSLESDTATAA